MASKRKGSVKGIKMSDINIGQITEALNDKADRDLLNVDTGNGADVVIAYQKPTEANGYIWYRRYASGWVEQGGFATGSGSSRTSNAVDLPITMADANYTVTTTHCSGTGTDTSNYYSYVSGLTQTGFTISTYGGRRSLWVVYGMAA